MKLVWTASEALSLSVSGGLATAAADTNSRYFAYAPGPGGFQIGNPSLAAEKRWSVDVGAQWHGSQVDARIGAYLHHVQDYVLRTLIDRRDANGDGTPDRIYGFENGQAQLMGGWAEFGVRHVAEQGRISDAFGEDKTPAFTTLHLRLGLHLWQYGLMEVGVENLLGTQYHEHLTREVLLPVGDLKAGDELPALGRRVYVRLRGTL